MLISSVADNRVGAYLFQKLHILATHSSLAEFKQSVRSGRIVQDDLEDLGTEEVCQRVPSSVRCGSLFGHGERGRRCVVVSRPIIAGKRTIPRSDLVVGIYFVIAHSTVIVGCEAVAVDVIVLVDVVVVAILSGHLSCYQRHDLTDNGGTRDEQRQACQLPNNEIVLVNR